eukprot:gene11041-biopygen7816
MHDSTAQDSLLHLAVDGGPDSVSVRIPVQRPDGGADCVAVERADTAPIRITQHRTVHTHTRARARARRGGACPMCVRVCMLLPAVLGDTVGANEGPADGEPVGGPVGAPEGDPDGDDVGAAVGGEALGETALPVSGPQPARARWLGRSTGAVAGPVRVRFFDFCRAARVRSAWTVRPWAVLLGTSLGRAKGKQTATMSGQLWTV